MLVLNKPMGLAVQGGSGTTRHVDGMLEVLRAPGPDGQRPRLVHRLDKDTAGCLLVAKTRFAAAALAKTFRSRSARKIYWALVAGVPKPRQGRISTFLAKEEREDDVDHAHRAAWRRGREPRGHLLRGGRDRRRARSPGCRSSRSPAARISCAPTWRISAIRSWAIRNISQKENWELPGGMQNRLHLLARRIAVPHPRGGTIDVTAPLPPHMQQSWNLLGLDADALRPDRRRAGGVAPSFQGPVDSYLFIEVGEEVHHDPPLRCAGRLSARRAACPCAVHPPPTLNPIPAPLPPPAPPPIINGPLGQNPPPGVSTRPRSGLHSDRTIQCQHEGSSYGLRGRKLQAYTRSCANAN